MATKTTNQARPGAQLRRAFATPMGLVAIICLALVLFLAAFAPIIWGEASQTRDLTNLSGGPTPEHWAGTDAGGRDMLARVLVASRLSIMMALESTAISLVMGLILGSAPIILGRRAGRAVNWFIGIAVAFPGLLLALFFAVVFGSGAHQAAVAIGLAGGPSFARLCQTLIAGVLGRDYVAAAKVGGVGRFRLFGRHVLPNIGEPLVVNATIGAGNALLAFASLSFLGLGVQMPQFDWGRLLKECLEQQFRFHP
ncbi:MAG: ABC transporter permease, partial [Bifidobacteriaceae bacterium]|nr:ABC transporter permease [Bifidobacteriaceae bacterium]